MKEFGEQPEQKGEVQFLFVGVKAGIDQSDSSRISKVVLEASQSSDYYQRQLEKRHTYDERIKHMLKMIDEVREDPKRLNDVTSEVESRYNEIQNQLILDRTWVHFDMDMFFVACEIRDRPELKDLPVATGGMSMISTANYVARKYGVRSAMPGFIAKQLCPQLIFIKSDFEKYKKASEQFKNVLYAYDPNLESMGLDEANLDLTDYLKTNNVATESQIQELCKEIRNQIFEATNGLTCSCGIGPNKMIAKIGTDMNKPNGQFLVSSDVAKVRQFMKNLPIRKIPGIGNVTEQLLNGISIRTCEDIIKRQVDIRICFNQLSFDSLVSRAIGVSRCYHVEEVERKSISVSRTFQAISSIEEINEKIKEVSKLLSESVKKDGKVGRHIAVSFKTHKFIMKSKNKLIDKYIQDELSIEKYARELAKELLPTEPLRLIGIRLSHLENYDSLQKGLSRFFQPTSKKGSPKVFDTDDEYNFENLQEISQEPIEKFEEQGEQEQKQNKEANESDSWEANSEDLSNYKNDKQTQSCVHNDQLPDYFNNLQETLQKNHHRNPSQLSEITENFDEDNSLLRSKENNFQFQQNKEDNQNKIIKQVQGKHSLEELKILQVESQDQQTFKRQLIKNFECPICFEKIDSFGNSAFINTHINFCLEQQSLNGRSLSDQYQSSNSNQIRSEKIDSNSNSVQKKKNSRISSSNSFKSQSRKQFSNKKEFSGSITNYFKKNN